MPLRAASSLDDFLARPLGSYLVGSSFIYWVARPRLCGFAIWGRPSASDVETIVRAKAYEWRETTPRHASIADSRRLTGIDVGAYEAFARHVAERRSTLANHVEKLAYLPPAGNSAAAAVAVGFFARSELPYPVSEFAELGPALDWLGHSDPRLAAELEEVQANATGATTLLDALRRMLVSSGDLSGVSIEAAARALAMSERTLQRRLRESETTFQNEVALARIAKAEILMAESDAPISTIAIDVGFASPQHFARRFRELRGESPTDWRARTRK